MPFSWILSSVRPVTFYYVILYGLVHHGSSTSSCGSKKGGAEGGSSIAERECVEGRGGEKVAASFSSMRFSGAEQRARRGL